MQPDDETWMRRAIDLARQGDVDPGSNPIGCVIVRDGQVIGEGHNEVARRFDPTAHAEIVAIRDAGQRLSCSEFRGATLYSTLQPCGMCSMAVIWSKISRVVYGAGRGDVHEMYFEARHLDTMDYISDAYRDDLSIEGGMLAHDCAGFYEARDAAVPKDEQVNL